MLELKINAMKERLWPAGIAALVLHSLMIAAMALGITYPQGVSPQDFGVEVIFTSSMVAEVDSERREEAGEGYLLPQANYQGENPSVASYSSPATPLRLHADFSRKGRGEQPVSKLKVSKTVQSSVEKKASANPVPSFGGYPSGESNDAFPVFNPPPIYPNEAKRRGIQGVVLVRLSLTQTGAVDKATTLPPHIDSLLEDAALSAVHTWRFKPGIRTLEVPIEFKLEGLIRN